MAGLSANIDEQAICLSFDLDWAPDFIIDALHQRLVDAGVPATVFCTHESPAVTRLLALPEVEAGLHPNFLPREGVPTCAGAEGRVIRELQAFVPSARGLRSHSLYFHSGLLAELHRAGLDYLSNDLCFLGDGLAAWTDYSGMVRLPIFWEDDVHCVYFGGDAGSFALQRLALDRPGLKVFNFHPVHLYLNTRDLAHYRRHKEALRDPTRAAPLRQDGAGVSELFDALLGAVDRDTLTSLAAACDAHRASHPYQGQFARFLATLEPTAGDKNR